MTLPRLTAVAVATLAAACALADPAWSATGGARACTKAGYSYAGIQTLAPARGLSTRLTISRAARVTSGHVAAWIGVGGDSAWLQIGVSAVGDGTMELYYEVTAPGSDTEYMPLGPVTAGDSHVLTVLETSPDGWVVRLDGAAVSSEISFPGSHGSWSPMATTESYDGGLTGCNAYGFQFSELKSSPAPQIWQVLGRVRSFHDAGHLLTTPAPGTIVVNRR